MKKTEFHDVVGVKRYRLISSIHNETGRDSFSEEKVGIPLVLHAHWRSKNRVFIWQDMPQFFRDIELGAMDIYCVQGRVRKRNLDKSFEKFEDKFFLIYDNYIPEESTDAFSARSNLMNEKEMGKEQRQWEISTRHVSSNSAIFSGNCHDTFRRWIAQRTDSSNIWSFSE